MSKGVLRVAADLASGLARRSGAVPSPQQMSGRTSEIQCLNQKTP